MSQGKRDRDRTKKRGGRASADVRHAQILSEAAAFFSEHGFAAQTRALAENSGIAQRQLYRHFPSKGALIDEVYDREILGPFKAAWLAMLGDRSRPAEQRLHDFYLDYFTAVLTRKWLRLFLFASLGGTAVAPDYIQSTIKRLLHTLVEEVAAEKRVALPADETLIHEIGWVLHGAVSHLAIRRHIYGADDRLPVAPVLALQIRSFLDGFESAVRMARSMPTTSVESSIDDNR